MASSFIPVAAALAVLAPVALQATPAQTAPAPVTFAQTAPAALLGAERDNVVAAAATALSKVSTAKGTFTQIDPNGYISTGNFALQRPGRVLFDYDDPVPITIRADGATVALTDEELETQDRVPLSSTPLSLLLDDNIAFGDEADIVSATRTNDALMVTMQSRSEEVDGTLTLIMNPVTYELLSWTTTDGLSSGETRVTLNDVETGVKHNPRIFRITDIDDGEADRDRR